MSIRFVIAGLFGVASLFVSGNADTPLQTQRVEACGIKVAVKAAPPSKSRQLRRREVRQPIATGGSRVAKRTRLNQRSERQPVATGGNRSARSAKRTTRPKTNPTVARRKVVKEEPKTTPETNPETPVVKEEPKVVKTDPVPVKEPEVTKPDTTPDTAPATTAAVSVEIYFETGESGVSSESESDLQEVVEWLKANPQGKLIVEGHTDPVGSSGKNRQLSRQRADSVASFLANAAGVEMSQFKVKGHGESKLRYPRNSPKNRRVLVKSR